MFIDCFKQPWISNLQLLDQFDYGQDHFNGVVHLTGACHEHDHRLDTIVGLILLKKPIVVKVDLQKLCQRLQRVQRPIEVLEHDLGAIFFLNFLGVHLAVFLLNELDEILQLHICVHLVTSYCL